MSVIVLIVTLHVECLFSGGFEDFLFIFVFYSFDGNKLRFGLLCMGPVDSSLNVFVLWVVVVFISFGKILTNIFSSYILFFPFSLFFEDSNFMLATYVFLKVFVSSRFNRVL